MGTTKQYSIPEVHAALEKTGYTTEREHAIQKTFLVLTGKHGASANVTDTDVCDFLNKQILWCHHYTYLPFVPSDLLEPCGYCKHNKALQYERQKSTAKSLRSRQGRK